MNISKEISMRVLKMVRKAAIVVGLIVLFSWPQGGVFAWTEHPLLSYPVLASMAKIRDAAPVKAESLDTFLRDQAKEIERFLEGEETWDRTHIQVYLPLPVALTFRSDADKTSAVPRFCSAIRINGTTRLPLYLGLLPGQPSKQGPPLRPQDLSFLKDLSDWKDTGFVSLKEGDTVVPLEVVVSATDEPDLLGLDIGLFEDNQTTIGKSYGFGRQPFGNPHLEYGTQPPFHMGFYHEPKIMFALAGFLKRTYPEYRIHMYKGLSELAFRTGHPYWGWRFMGWGLHYLADLSQPYHSTVLPGVSTVSALWTNTLDMVGFHGAKANAIQLVSNRHAAFEKFTHIILRRAYEQVDQKSPILLALSVTTPVPVYTDAVPRQEIARLSHEKAGLTDKILEAAMPRKFVSDPSFELGTSTDRGRIIELMTAEKGSAGKDKLTLLAKDLLKPFAIYGQSFVNSIVK
jgi:hypothetical protein